MKYHHFKHFKQVKITGESRFRNGYPVGTLGYVIQTLWKEHKSGKRGYYVTKRADPNEFSEEWFVYTRINFKYTGLMLSIPHNKISKRIKSYLDSL